MPSRDDHSSGRTEVGGENQQEPLIDRRLEVDLPRQHIARAAETGKGHAVQILGKSDVGKSQLAAEAAPAAVPSGRRSLEATQVSRARYSLGGLAELGTP
jgi:hypothetical protein